MIESTFSKKPIDAFRAAEAMDPLWAGILAMIANPRRRTHWLVRNIEQSRDNVFFESFDQGESFVRWQIPWTFYEPIKFLNDGGLAFLTTLSLPDTRALIYRHGTDGEWRDLGLRLDARAELYSTGVNLFVQASDGLFRLEGLNGEDAPRCFRVETPRRM